MSDRLTLPPLVATSSEYRAFRVCLPRLPGQGGPVGGGENTGKREAAEEAPEIQAPHRAPLPSLLLANVGSGAQNGRTTLVDFNQQ